MKNRNSYRQKETIDGIQKNNVYGPKSEGHVKYKIAKAFRARQLFVSLPQIQATKPLTREGLSTLKEYEKIEKIIKER